MRIAPFPKATLPFQTEASQESRALCLPEGPLTSSAWGQTLPFVQTRCEWLGPGSHEALPPGHGPAPTRLLCQPGPRLSGQEHAPGVGGVWSGGPDVPFPVQLRTGLCPRGDRQGLICEGRKFVFPNDSHQGSPREAVGMMGSGMRAPERTPVCLAEPDWPSSPGGARSVFSCSLRLVCVCPRVHPRVLRHTHTAAGRAEHRDGGGGGPACPPPPHGQGRCLARGTTQHTEGCGRRQARGTWMASTRRSPALVFAGTLGASLGASEPRNRCPTHSGDRS